MDVVWNGLNIEAEVNFKKLNDNASEPLRGSEYAAGYDLYAVIEESVAIQPHSTAKIGTGIAVSLPKGTFGAIFARSGLATKQGLRPANCVGVVDCDYRGEVIVAVHNDSEFEQIIQPNERIAQFVLMPFICMNLTQVADLDDTVRGSSGFGSTGV